MDLLLHVRVESTRSDGKLPSAREIAGALRTMIRVAHESAEGHQEGWDTDQVSLVTGKDLYETMVVAARLNTGPWTLLPAATRNGWNAVAGMTEPEPDRYPDAADMAAVVANLASLNEIVAELVAYKAAEPDEAEFARLVLDVLKNHNWSLGFEFRGERGSPDALPSLRLPGEGS